MRYTKKIKNGFLPTTYEWNNKLEKPDNSENLKMALKGFVMFHSCQKLGQLEDIEEELGIDLKTFFRIYSAKHFYLKGKDYKWKIHHRCNNGIVVGTNKLIYLPFKFYGKTWALTKEELEND